MHNFTCSKVSRDVPSRVRVHGRVLRHYSAESEYYLILDRALKHYHFDLFLLCSRFGVEIRTFTDVMDLFFFSSPDFEFIS